MENQIWKRNALEFCSNFWETSRRPWISSSTNSFAWKFFFLLCINEKPREFSSGRKSLKDCKILFIKILIVPGEQQLLDVSTKCIDMMLGSKGSWLGRFSRWLPGKWSKKTYFWGKFRGRCSIFKHQDYSLPIPPSGTSQNPFKLFIKKSIAKRENFAMHKSMKAVCLSSQAVFTL